MPSSAGLALAIVALATGCSLDWPPPRAGADAGAPDAGPDADAAAPSDCDRCPAVAKYARPDGPVTGATREVPPGGDLQAALDEATPGDEIVLEAGATYAGSFHLPVKQGDAFITVRSSAPASALPGPCTRLGPDQFGALARLVGPVGEPAVIAADGAHHYRLVALELTIDPGPPFPLGVVEIGQGTETDVALLPHDIELDRVWVHGDASKGSQHGVLLNGSEIRVMSSWISDIKNEADTMSAVRGWNGPGPLVVVNDHLESAGTTVSVGEWAPSVAGLVPADVEIGFSDLVRPLAWNPDDPAWDGSAWRTGAAVVLGSAQHVVVEGNVVENAWAYQPFRLEPGAPSEGAEPWGLVQDVTIAANVVRHVGSGFMLSSGSAADPARHTRGVTIRDNLMTEVGTSGGDGRLFGIVGDVAELHISHNTVLQEHHILYANAPSPGFVFDDNIVRHNEYGFFCEAMGSAGGCLDAFFPGHEVRRNVIIGLPTGYSPSDFPPDNFFPAYEVGFVDDDSGDYHLAETSPYKGKATDGADVGVRFAEHDAAAACRTSP